MSNKPSLQVGEPLAGAALTRRKGHSPHGLRHAIDEGDLDLKAGVQLGNGFPEPLLDADMALGNDEECGENENCGEHESDPPGEMFGFHDVPFGLRSECQETVQMNGD